MKISTAFPSKYLRMDDLEGDVTYTIKTVSMEDVGQGDDKQHKPVIYFIETNKRLTLNPTNAGSIAEQYGDDTEAWGGRRITLFPDPEVTYMGKRTGAIRIRRQATTQPSRRRETTSTNTGVWSTQDAVNEAAKIGMDKDTLRKWLQDRGCKGWNSDRDTGPLKDHIAELALNQESDL